VPVTDRAVVKFRMSSPQGPDLSKPLSYFKKQLPQNENFAWGWLLMEELYKKTPQFKVGPEELTTILGPAAVLQHLGSSKELDEKRNQVQELILFYGNQPDTEENHAKITEGLDRLLVRLNWLHSQIKKAEKILKDDGWQFDPKLKKVKVLPLSNRPEELLNRLIRLCYEQYEHFRKSDEKSPQEIRQLIHDKLSLFFPTDILGVEPGGPIERAIQNRPK